MPSAFAATLIGAEVVEQLLKFGRAAGMNKPGFGQGAFKKLQGMGQAIKGGVGPTGTAMGNAAGSAAGSIVNAGSTAWEKGLVAGAWGKAKGSEAWKAFKSSPKMQRNAVIGGAAAFGYATSDSEASTGQRLGRAAAFGFMGFKGNQIARSPGMKAGVTEGLLSIGNKEWKKGGKQIMTALGGPSKWGLKHSIGAGAFYGAMSSQTSILGGAVMGAAFDIGGRGLGRTWNADALDKFKSGYASKGPLGAFRAIPMMKTGLYAGMISGAYNSDGSILGTAGGALKGTLGGGAARFATNHPWITMGTVVPGMQVAGAAVGGANQMIQAGAPGFDTMNADGDLALALHRTRHG